MLAYKPEPQPGSLLQQLIEAPVRAGRVEWIGVRPDRGAPMRAVEAARLDPEGGLEGDHYAGRSFSRQLSLVAAESLASIASYLGRAQLPPELLRRNVVLRGINLLALQGARVRLGEALLEVTGLCHPCSRMEALLGPGGYNAVRGHGGILARVLEGGVFGLGDALRREERGVHRAA